MSTVIGIDPSLTGTGIAITSPLGTDVTTIATTGRKTDNLHARARRLRHIVTTIEGLLDDIDLAVIEAPALGQHNAGTSQLNGLWWAIIDALERHNTPVAQVFPGTLKKYATGKGNAGKDEVLLAVSRKYADVDVTTNDQADALVLAAMGAHHLGDPLVALPKTHTDALTKVTWPADPLEHSSSNATSRSA